MNKAVFLGIFISKEGIKVDPQKVKTIIEQPKPTNATKARSFLALAIYYRRFMKGFSKIASQLINLLKKVTKFKWTNECEEAF